MNSRPRFVAETLAHRGRMAELPETVKAAMLAKVKVTEATRYR
jgi:hypothetical protein